MEKADVCPQKNTFTCNYKPDVCPQKNTFTCNYKPDVCPQKNTFTCNYKPDVCPQKNTFIYTCNYKHDSFTLPYFCVFQTRTWISIGKCYGIFVFNGLRDNELWCLMPLSTIFQFYWWRKHRKPLTCCASLTNFITYVVSSTPHLSGIRTHNVSSLI